MIYTKLSDNTKQQKGEQKMTNQAEKSKKFAEKLNNLSKEDKIRVMENMNEMFGPNSIHEPNEESKKTLQKITDALQKSIENNESVDVEVSSDELLNMMIPGYDIITKDYKNDILEKAKENGETANTSNNSNAEILNNLASIIDKKQNNVDFSELKNKLKQNTENGETQAETNEFNSQIKQLLSDFAHKFEESEQQLSNIKENEQSR